MVLPQAIGNHPLPGISRWVWSTPVCPVLCLAPVGAVESLGTWLISLMKVLQSPLPLTCVSQGVGACTCLL